MLRLTSVNDNNFSFNLQLNYIQKRRCLTLVHTFEWLELSKRFSMKSDVSTWLSEHVSRCTLRQNACLPCQFIQVAFSRRRAWLEGFVKDGKFVAGCKVCRSCSKQRANFTSPVMLTKQALDRHESRKCHVSASKLEPGNAPINGKLVPAEKAFRILLELMREGVCSLRQLEKRMQEHRIGMKKISKMKWCLGEARRQMFRKFFASEGLVLTFHQDERKHWLAIRFTGCNDELIQMHGLLGMMDMRPCKGSTSSHLKEQTLQSMFDIHTPCRNPPDTAVVRSAHPEPSLIAVAKMMNDTEVVNRDAASNEQLAGEMLRGRKLDDLCIDTDVMPNLLIVNKDKCHASRRLCSRGFACDPYLKSAHQDLVGKNSFVQKIQYSVPFKQVWVEFVAKQEQCPVHKGRVKDMRATVRRFEACQRPYFRRVFYWKALIASGMVVARCRRGNEEAGIAIMFLRNETEERAIQYAMMGEAGDEQYTLTLFLDQESFDTSELRSHVSVFLARINGLFRKGLCLHTRGGLTKVMLDSLSSTTTVVIPDGRGEIVKNLGGDFVSPDSEIVKRCLKRMVAWVDVCEAIAQAEFPVFELFQSLSPMNLRHFHEAGVEVAPCKLIPSNTADDLLRLAKVLKLPKDSTNLNIYDK